MVKLHMRIQGDVNTIKVLRDLSQNGLDQIVQETLDEIGEMVIQEAKQNLTQSNKSGALTGSVKVISKGTNYIEIGTDKLQGKILELGRKEVRPVNVKALHWTDAQGNEVYSKYSKPVAPDPWLEPALNIQLPTITKLLKDKLDRRAN